MAKMGKFSVSGMQKLQKQLNKIQQSDVETLIVECAEKLAQEFLKKVKKRTPVGDYSGNSYVCSDSETGRSHKGSKIKGKRGGTLINSWKIGEIQKINNMYSVEIINDAKNEKGQSYASYVEYGHRTKNGGFTEGHFMLTFSEQEIENIAPKFIEARIKKFLEGCMK